MIKNDQLLAVFNSAHHVMKAESILKRCGLTILLIPAPRALSTDCGLAIRFDRELYEKILTVLTTENNAPVFIYQKLSDSQYKLIWNYENCDSTNL
jgi:hypothetical protein